VTAAASHPLMIIDDDDDLRAALTMILTSEGYDVVAYGSARHALGALQSGSRPFLILLDLMMASMSGWEFRAAQLDDAALAPIPVVVLTAASSWTDEGRALQGVEILDKPFDLDSLLAVVGRHAAAGGGSQA
jgi:CheY-like chemotaxis protein